MKNLKSLNSEYLRLDEEKFREILPEVEPSRAEAWEASDAREETYRRQEKRNALSWNALGATRGNMDFLSMINAFERSEREPDIVEAEAALVPTNEPIAVSLDARQPTTSWQTGARSQLRLVHLCWVVLWLSHLRWLIERQKP